MSKTPEEYFQEQSFSLPGGASGQTGGSGLSAAELTFIRKYMGLDASEALHKLGIEQKAELPAKEKASAELAENRLPAAASQVDSLILSLDEERPEIDVPRKLTDILSPPPAAAEKAGSAVIRRTELEADVEKPETEHKIPELVMEPVSTRVTAPGGQSAEKTPPPAPPVLADQALHPSAPQPQPEVKPVAPALLEVKPVAAALPPETKPTVQPPPAPVAPPAPPVLADQALQPSAPQPQPEVKPVAPALPPEVPAERAAELEKLKSAKQAQISPETRPTMADIYDGMDIGDALDHFLRNEAELQMVAFYVGDQEFTVPTVIVQEVIHYSPPVKLPVAPPFVAGVINLRGKVTPLVYLRDILEVKQKIKREDRFIVICRYQGLQIGLIIEKVHSMYRVTQKDIDWGIEAHLGINVDYVSGLLKHDDHLIGIVAVDKIVTNLLSDKEK
ncbi:MAG: chemotaxis protein CheW [Deltaproteobacteria bacterium]|jgi:purine-binding chemotaxis protein CheW|nr:chemotaxis protein CheW [Deltaproteobacteria bacterium]